MKKTITNSCQSLRLKLTYIFLTLLLFSGQSWGATTIHSNDCSAATSGWSFTNGISLAIQQSGYWLLDDVGDYITSQTFDVSSYSGLALTFQVATYGSGTNHSCKVEYSTDNGSTWNSTTFTSATPSSSTYISAGEWSIGTVISSQFKLRWSSPSGGSKGVRIDNILLSGTLTGAAPPVLTADATNNDVDNTIDIAFTDDATWRTAITGVKIGGTALTLTTDYLLTAGNLQLLPSGGNVLLKTSGSKSVTVESTGYTIASVTQLISAGDPTANSTATINSALALGTSQTITCTAKDQYNNLVAGYTFKYDVGVTNNNATTVESYTIDGTAQISSITDVNIGTITNASGVATFTAAVPAVVDDNDGVSIQVQLNNGTTNVGSAFTYSQVAPQITISGIDLASASLQQNSTDNVVYRMKIDVLNNSTNLTTLNAISNGNYVASDIQTNGFKLWYSTDAIFGSDVNIGSVSSLSTGSGEMISFIGMNRAFPVGTAYLFITTDIATTATVNHTISCESTANSDLTFLASPTFSGSSFATANLHSIIAGPTTLLAGDIAIIEFVSTNPDKLSFITYVQLNPNTIINFTDNGYINVSTIRTGEGFLTYTAPSTIAAGTVVSWYNGMTITGTGWNSSSPSNFAIATGDQLFAYQGIWGFGHSLIYGLNCGNLGWITSGTASSNTSYLPTELLAGSNAITFSEANGNYNLISSGSISALKSLTVNPANWTKSSASITTPSWSFSLGSATTINQDATVQDLNIAIGESVTINAGINFTVSGNLINEAGTSGLILKSDANGTASLINATTDVQVTAECYLTGNVFHQLAIPISGTIWGGSAPGQTGDVFMNCTLDRYIEASNSYLPISETDDVTYNRGYMVKYFTGTGPAYKTIHYSGGLNAGNKTFTINYSGSLPNDPLKGYNLIANPYSSAINASIDTWTKTNVNDNIWVWDESFGNFRTWNGSTGDLAGGIIPSMQSFFIQSNAASPSITLPNSARTHNSQAYYKSTLADEVMLKVAGNNYSDAIVVTFKPTTTNDFDKFFDVRKMYGLQEAPQLFSICNNEKLSINGLPPFTTSSTIPVGLQIGVNGNYSITATELNSFAATTYIYLKDLTTQTITDLNQHPTYTFTAATNDNVNRFQLIFALSPLAISNNVIQHTGIYAYDNTITVNSNETIQQIAIYNTMGQLIKTVENTNGMTIINLQDDAKGYYIVRVVTNNNVYAEKVWIK